MNKLYTCMGDDGSTDLADGRRVLKDDVIIELLGTIDEFSSMLGVAKVHLDDEALMGDIEKIQNMSFTVMAEIAGGKEAVAEEIIKSVEEMTDKYCQGFAGFSKAGKTKASAFLDVARCIIRRAERIAVKEFRKGGISRVAMCWLNRVSDLSYAMARYAAKE